MKSGLALVGLLLAVSTAMADPVADARAKYEHGRKLFQLGKYDEALPDFEGAFELDGNPAYLFNVGMCHRFLKHYDRAIELFTHYLEINPEPRPGKQDPTTDEVHALIDAIRRDKEAADKAAADKIAADKAIADKAAADKIAADKAFADRVAAEAEAKRLAAENKHIRLAFDVGVSIIHLVGKEESRSPSLGGRIAVTYTRRHGPWTFDVGGSWQVTTIPYDRMDANHVGEAAAVFYSQAHAIGAVTRTLVGPLWGRLGVGLGFANYGGLKKGNPITEEADGQDNIAAPAARADFALGYRYSSTIDFVLGVASASWAGRNKDLSSMIDHTTTVEGLYLGIYIKI